METLSYPTGVRSKKTHSCNFCGDKIVEKEIYIKSTHKYDGQVYDWKAHKYCSEIAQTLKMYDDADEGVDQEHFMETISATHDDLLISKFTNDNINHYSDIIQQIRKVQFRDKLWYVIRYYAKIKQQRTK